MQNPLRVLAAALFCAVLGLIIFQSQGQGAASMNLCGVVAFGAVGASIGCLASSDENDSDPLDFLRRWW